MQRKWGGLVATYKDATLRMNKTGEGKINFKFYKEIESLVGYRHDIVPPVTGTASGVVVHMPEVLGISGEDSKLPGFHKDKSPVSSTLDADSMPKARRKRKITSNDIMLDYLRESDKE